MRTCLTPVTGPRAQQTMGDTLSNDRRALEFVFEFGGIDGAHHKQWLIDQMVRALCGNEEQYKIFVADYEAGEDGPHTYEWDTGVAP